MVPNVYTNGYCLSKTPCKVRFSEGLAKRDKLCSCAQKILLRCQPLGLNHRDHHKSLPTKNKRVLKIPSPIPPRGVTGAPQKEL